MKNKPSDWTPLNKKTHTTYAWKKFSDYLFASTCSNTPVLMAELNELLPWYTLAFVKNQQSYDLVAILSLKPETNVYVSEQGKWRVPYVPAQFRGYPFKMQAHNLEAKQFVLCLDEASPLLQPQPTADTQPLFNNQGQFSTEFQQVIDFLSQCQQNKLATDQLIDQLNQCGLIVPWDIEYKLSPADATHQRAEGYYRIDEAKLKNLQAHDYMQLAQTSALELAYAQKLSQARLQDIIKVHARQHLQSKPQLETLDLDKFFGEEDDSLKF